MMKLRSGVVVVGLALAACGGSSSESAPSAVPLASSASPASGAAEAAPPPSAQAAGAPAVDSAAVLPAPIDDKSQTPSAAADVRNTGEAGSGKLATPLKPSKPAPPKMGAGPAAAHRARTFDCGEKGQKPCPAQAWMKSNMAPASASGNAELLAKQFEYVAAHAPPNLVSWVSIAKEGAVRAKDGNLDGAKLACKTCHDQYKARYKAEMRDRNF